MAVEILESCMVTPSEETPKHGLWLSNLDLMVGRSFTPTFYVYRSCSVPDKFLPAILKAALSKALVPFYPLAGRLAQDDAGRPEIQCTGEGVVFVTARAESTLDVLGDFTPSDELRRMLIPSAAEPGGPNVGILAVFQTTFFQCGGVCLGVATHHTAADGLASIDFVNTWAAIAKGEELPAKPCHDRTLLRARSPPVVQFDHAEYACLGLGLGGEAKPKLRVEAAILPVSRHQVEALRGLTGKLSTFKAVAAHVWRCACSARGLALTEDARLYMAADARARIRPPLPAGYFGNAIFRVSAVAKVEEITSRPLDTVAHKLSAAAEWLEEDGYVQSLLDYLDEQAGSRQGQSLVMPQTDLWVISWLGLPIYDTDFGWGRPAFMGRTCFKSCGVAYVMPAADGDGQLNVVVGMEPESLARFKEMFYKEY